MINKIAHLADIHVRLHSRHDEYRMVFDMLYKSLIDNKINENGLICIAGDVFHSKITLSPECVKIVSDFLRRLTTIAPVGIILGNHCLLQNNPDRLDSLTPIVESLELSNLHFFKTSGIYTIDNIDFGVFSIVGDSSEWPIAKTNTQNKQIALYHGPVTGATNEMGFIFKDHCISANIFDGYDCVLLGDIHKTQYIKEKNPTIMYCGSLIQSNFGESLEGHGWVEWDLNADTQIFHKVENEYGYVTLNIDDGQWEVPDKLPNKARIRLMIHGSTSAADIKKASAILKKKTTVMELLVLNTASISTNASVGPSLSAVVKDVHDVTYQNTLIRKYLSGTADDILGEIEKINIETNAALVNEYFPKNIKWIPKVLKFDNLFSYGVGNSIDFSKLAGIYGIFSPNATGKSSLINSICFALYDKAPTAFRGNHIMNTNSKTCKCEFTFEVDSVLYKIVRSGVKKKGGEVKMDVEFYHLDSDWVNMSGKDRRDTNAIIRSLVGEYEDFVLTLLSVQNNNSIFLDKGQTDRKELLSQFLGLTIFDKLSAVATEKFKDIKSALKLISVDDYSSKLNILMVEIENLKSEQDRLTNNLIVTNKELLSSDGMILDLEKQKVKIEAVTFDHKKVVTHRAQLEVDNVERTKKLGIYQWTLANLLESEHQMERLAKEVDIKRINQTAADYADTHTELIMLTNDLAVATEKASGLKYLVEMFHDHKYDPECVYCATNQLVVDGQKNITEYQTTLNSIALMEKQRAILAVKVADLTKQKEQDTKTVLVFAKKSEASKELAEHTLMVERLKAEIEDVERDIDAANKQLEYYYTNQSNIELNAQLEIQIADIKRERSEVAHWVITWQKELNGVDSKLITAETAQKSLLEDIKVVEALSQQHKAYDLYLSAIDQDGIAYKLIEQVLPVMEQTINGILSQIVSFSLQLYCDGKNVQIDLLYDDSKKWPLELASGMEKFISGLAIRMGMLSISHLPKSNFIILDEGFSNLDADNLNSVSKVLDFMKQQFDFLIIISHLTEMKDMVDELIEIEQIDDRSHIEL